jgi:hypothetical protein
VVPSVLPPSGPNPNRPNGPSGQIKIEIPEAILNLITDGDEDFKKQLVKQYSLDKSLSLGQMKKKINSSDPYELSNHFFHYIAALPLLSKTTDFAEPNKEFEFFNNFKHFTMSGFPAVKVQSDKRMQLAMIFLLLQTKAKTKANESLQDLLDKSIKFSVNNLFHLSMPTNIAFSGHMSFSARSYLEDKLFEVVAKVENIDLKSAIGSLLQKVSSKEAFRTLLEEVSDHASTLEETREQHPDFNYDVSERNVFTFAQNQALLKKVRASFDKVVSATQEFISCFENKSGFNGKFLGILKDDLREFEYSQDISVNFSGFDEDDLQLLQKQSEVTIDTMKDLASIGYKNFGFANSLTEYCFADFAGFLSCSEDLSTEQTQRLVLDFLSPKNGSRDFKNYLALDSLKKIKESDPYVAHFIDFIDRLKQFSLNNDVKVEIFPIDDGTALSEWDIEDSDKRVYFNNHHFAAQDPDAYNMNFNLFKFNPNEKFVTDEDLESCCITNVWGDNEFDSTEFLVSEALPLVVMDIASKANQKISDGDVFTIAGAEEMNQFVRDGFIEDTDNSSDPQMKRLCVLPSFIRDDQELEPDLYKIFFVEAKDEDDGDEDFSDVKTPDGSLVLT